jgi:hypothetical protein
VTIWILETNLFWSARVCQTVRGLGHEAEVFGTLPEGAPDVAILNLSDPGIEETAHVLRARGVRTIGHAGHRETELLELGRRAGVDVVATNREITTSLERLLKA